MGLRTVRWETMDKDDIPLSKLAEHYLITCRTEGKTASTLRGYHEKLGRLIRWSDGACLRELSVELAREYISYLQSAPKYEGQPDRISEGQHMSAANVQNHVRVLRAFSSWLHREKYTDENRLAILRLPKAPQKVVETLSDEEIVRLFSVVDQNTSPGCRDAAILLLLLDTGLRCSELLGLRTEDVHMEDRWLKVMGKGQKERIVPFGGQAVKLLQRYVYYFRPEPVFEDLFFLCFDGRPMSENTIKRIFSRLARKAGVSRLHIHLLRHTFATRYLMNGGDAFSLQLILGHSTLEMTRRYVDIVALGRVVMQKQLSAMDKLFMSKKAATRPGHPTAGRHFPSR